mmetsp:Transcript_33244/g.58334  ORF Transcript_33244/g.58334 Transcript_33244/m.58334 type:complete len:324 (-) Transcript_33244:6-977(-)
MLLLVRDAPGTDGVVRVTRVQHAAVGAEGDRRALGLRVLALSLGRQLADHVLVLQIEDTDRALRSSAQPVAVGREADLVDRLTARQFVQVVATAQIPQAARTVLASGGAERAVRGDRHGRHVASVAAQRRLALAGGKVPDLDVVVPPARDDQGRLEVGREAHAADPVGVSLVVHRVHALALHVPDLEHVVAAAGHNLAVVGRERNRQDVLGVAEELGNNVAGLQAPEAERAVPGGRDDVLTVVRQSNVRDEAGVALQAAVGGREVAFRAVALGSGLPRQQRVVARSRHDLGGRVRRLGARESGDPPAVALHLTLVVNSHFDLQ